MKKIIGFLGITALLLFLAPEPKVEGQIGYQLSAAQITAALPVTADTILATDDIYIGFGASADVQIEFVSASNIMLVSGVNGASSFFHVRDSGGSTNLIMDDLGTIYGNAVEIASSLRVMNGSDTMRGLFVDLTNVDHTGSSNLLYGIDIDGITGDADASEYALHVGTGWDSDIVLDSTLAVISFGNGGQLSIKDSGSSNTLFMRDTGLNTDYIEFQMVFAAMNGSDVQKGIFIDPTNQDHTGSNEIGIIAVDSFTGDAEAYESFFLLGDGADYLIDDLTNTALGTLTWTTNSDKDANTASGTLKVFINGTLYHIQLYADS